MSQRVGWVVGVVVVAAAAAGCFSQPAATSSRPEPEAGEQKGALPTMTEFATGADAKNEPAGVKFDSDRALKYLKQLCDIGPRISASEGMKKQQELVEKHFKD